MNGAFRPKGGNGVHGLFDDAGNVSSADKGVTPEGSIQSSEGHLYRPWAISFIPMG